MLLKLLQIQKVPLQIMKTVVWAKLHFDIKAEFFVFINSVWFYSVNNDQQKPGSRWLQLSELVHIAFLVYCHRLL